MTTGNFDNIYASGNIEASGYFISDKVPVNDDHLVNKAYLESYTLGYNSINTRVNQLAQDILTKPDNTAFRNYQSIHEQKLDELRRIYDELLIQVRNLASLYTNLYITVNENHAEFQSYTGSV